MTAINSNNLYRALYRLYRQMHRFEHHHSHGPHEFYRGQANLLTLLLENDGASQREFAELLDIRPSSLTEMVVKMEAARLITRKQDEKDQRVMCIFLTEEGKKAAERLVGTTGEFTNSIFNTLTEEEREQLLKLIEKLSAGLESMTAPETNIEDRDMFHGHHHRQHAGPGFWDHKRGCNG